MGLAYPRYILDHLAQVISSINSLAAKSGTYYSNFSFIVLFHFSPISTINNTWVNRIIAGVVHQQPHFSSPLKPAVKVYSIGFSFISIDSLILQFNVLSLSLDEDEPAGYSDG